MVVSEFPQHLKLVKIGPPTFPASFLLLLVPVRIALGTRSGTCTGWKLATFFLFFLIELVFSWWVPWTISPGSCTAVSGCVSGGVGSWRGRAGVALHRPGSVRLLLQDSSLPPTAPALHWHTAGTDQLHHWKTWSCLLPPCSAASSFVQANTCMVMWWAGLRIELTWGRGRQGRVCFELDQFAAQTFVLAQRWGWKQAVRGAGCVCFFWWQWHTMPV